MYWMLLVQATVSRQLSKALFFLSNLLEEVFALKCVCRAAREPARGVRGHAPPKIFECVDAISCILMH